MRCRAAAPYSGWVQSGRRADSGNGTSSGRDGGRAPQCTEGASGVRRHSALRRGGRVRPSHVGWGHDRSDGRRRMAGTRRPGTRRRLRGLERRRVTPPAGRSSTCSWCGTHSPITELDPDDYYDFQVNRPNVSLIDGVSRRISWPTTRFSYCRPPGADFDLVLVHGIEPNMRWRAFCAELLGSHPRPRHPDGRDARRAVVRHPAHPPDPGHRHRLRRRGRRPASAWNAPATRGRPGSSACCRTHASRRASRPSPSGPACRTTCPSRRTRRRRWRCCTASRRCSTSPIPLAELPQQADEWQKLVDEMAAEDDEVTEYIRNLEERDDEIDRSEMTEASRRRDRPGVRALFAPARSWRRPRRRDPLSGRQHRCPAR